MALLLVHTIPPCRPQKAFKEAAEKLRGFENLRSGVFTRANVEPEVDGVDGQRHRFRIVQEVVPDAVIHGRSRRVDIVLSAEPGEGLVCISDDGAGLPDHDLVKRGLGLRSMAYRARMLGGTLVVRRQLPVGTVLSCTFRVPGHDACSEGVG